MLKDRPAITLSFLCIGFIVFSLGIYAKYVTPETPVSNVLLNETKKTPAPDIIFDTFTVKMPAQKDFTLCVNAKKAKIYKQDQSIHLSNLNCTYTKNNIFLGSIKAKSAVVKKQHNKVIFHHVQTKLNLSSGIQQKP